MSHACLCKGHLMDATDVKQALKDLPQASQWVTTGAIVDVLLDQMAAGKPVDPQAMCSMMGEMVEFAHKHGDRINAPA